jgi:hypothetical protein
MIGLAEADGGKAIFALVRVESAAHVSHTLWRSRMANVSQCCQVQEAFVMHFAFFLR